MRDIFNGSLVQKLIIDLPIFMRKNVSLPDDVGPRNLRIRLSSSVGDAARGLTNNLDAPLRRSHDDQFRLKFLKRHLTDDFANFPGSGQHVPEMGAVPFFRLHRDRSDREGLRVSCTGCAGCWVWPDRSDPFPESRRAVLSAARSQPAMATVQVRTRRADRYHCQHAFPHGPPTQILKGDVWRTRDTRQQAVQPVWKAHWTYERILGGGE